MTGKAKAVLDDLVARITAEGASRFVHDKLFTDDVDIPCRRWSLLNRFTVSLSGTIDARGFRQWNEVGRKVVKGASALYILVPIFASMKKDIGNEVQAEGETPSQKESPEPVLTGFRAMPVFRLEDTEGEPLPYELKVRSFDVSKLPLIEVAQKLGVTVRAEITRGYSAVYMRKTKEIVLGTENPQTFLHELSHAVDAALPDWNKDYAYGEVVAELSSCFLGSLYGVPVDIGSTKAYITEYAGKGHVAFKIVEALGRVEAIFRYIEKATKNKASRSSEAEHRTLGRNPQRVPIQKRLIA